MSACRKAVSFWDEGGQRRVVGGQHLEPEVLELGLHVGRGNGPVHLGGQARDDVGRLALGHEQAMPRGDLEILDAGPVECGSSGSTAMRFLDIGDSALTWPERIRGSPAAVSSTITGICPEITSCTASAGPRQGKSTAKPGVRFLGDLIARCWELPTRGRSCRRAG
jgi:hypothetical protein